MRPASRVGQATEKGTEPLTLVVKIGSSFITHPDGSLDTSAVDGMCDQVATCIDQGARIVLVTSGAMAAGLPHLARTRRPSDLADMQAVASVGQVHLMRAYEQPLARHGLVVGQLLLTKHDFHRRSQYLHARATLKRLLEIGVVPVINENDTIAVDELRFGENDRLAALVAHLIWADALVLLTDQPGLFSADPRLVTNATLIEEVHEIDAQLEATAGDSAGPLGSGGMASKLAAAKIASWSGVTSVIADAKRPNVLVDVLARVAALAEESSIQTESGVQSESAKAEAVSRQADDPRLGTIIKARERRLSSRKLWIAFGQASAGHILIDPGAVAAITDSGSSLLAVGVVDTAGHFRQGDAVEICDNDGQPIAKGITSMDRKDLDVSKNQRGAPTPIVVHRDNMVVLR